MSKCKILISHTHNPWFNLATEDWIFKEMDPKQRVLFLWRNSETVVIGRFQNPWVECRLDAMEKDNVLLARRQSGGGAVFHDLGNTNFTFMSGKEAYDIEENFEIIIEALKTFGIDAYRSGRNDLLIDERKFSGSAFKQKKDRSFHHGTLLIKADLLRLQNYLTPKEKKLESKGIKSVRSRVVNLTELKPRLNHESVCEAIISTFKQKYSYEGEIELLDHSHLESIPSLNHYYQELKDWKWRYGETPQFTHHFEHQFDWGGMDVHIDSHKGLIKDIKIFSDSLHPEMIALLMQSLKGKEYGPKGFSLTCDELIKEYSMYQEYLEELKSWMETELA